MNGDLNQEELTARLIQLTERMDAVMSATPQESEVSGKFSTQILDTDTNPSFINPGLPVHTKLTDPIQVKTPNGSFRTSKTTKFRLTQGHRTIHADVLVHDKLPMNLLSVKLIIERL